MFMSLAIVYKFWLYLCNLNDLWNIEIGSHWGQAFSNQVRLVRLLTMHVHHVLFRVDGHSLYVHFCTCSEHSDGNLTYKTTKKSECCQLIISDIWFFNWYYDINWPILCLKFCHWMSTRNFYNDRYNEMY